MVMSKGKAGGRGEGSLRRQPSTSSHSSLYHLMLFLLLMLIVGGECLKYKLDEARMVMSRERKGEP